MTPRQASISVWHQQPFEVAVLERDIRWGVVHYRNSRVKPGPNKLIRNWYILRQGQSFVGIGNTQCAVIRCWQFKSLFSRPRKKKIALTVRRLTPQLPNAPKDLIPASIHSLHLPTSITHVHLSVGELQVSLPSMVTRMNSTPVNLHFNINPPADEPVLKGVNDPI